MARIYYTNPDGTIGFVEANFDSAGRIKPTAKAYINNEVHSRKSIFRKIKSRKKSSTKYYTKAAIDNLVNNWKKANYIPDEKKTNKILNKIVDEQLKQYFVQKVWELNVRQDSCEQICCETTSVMDEEPTTKQKKELSGRGMEPLVLSTKKSKRKSIDIGRPESLQSPQPQCQEADTSISSIPSDSSSGFGPRKPKYGYARDRYGRVQERDCYIENCNSNPYHDNSDYDQEDDHDSVYDMFD